MAIRNYFVRTRVDGRKTTSDTGPVGRTGGFSTTIHYRDQGGITDTPIYVRGTAGEDGTLWITVFHGDQLVYQIVSTR